MRPDERDISSFFLEDADKNGHTDVTKRWLKGDTATVIVAGRYEAHPST